MKLKLICIALAIILSNIYIAENSEAVSSEDRRKSYELTLSASEHMNRLAYDTALPLLEKAIKLDPENQSAVRYLLIYNQQAVEPLCKNAAEAYYSEQYSVALDLWDRIIFQVPSESRRIQPLMDIALKKTRGKELEKKYEVAGRLIKEGRHEQAEQELESIIRDFPQQKRARKLLADLSGSLNSNIIRKHYTSALDSIKKGDHEKAVTELEAILKIEPTHPQAKRMIVNARRMKLKSTYEKANKFLTEGQYLKARQAYEKALKSNPSDSATSTTLERLDEITRLTNSLDGEGREVRLMRTSLYNYASAEGNVKVSVAAAWYASQLAPDNPMTNIVRNFIEEKNRQVLRLLDPPTGKMDVVEQKLFTVLNHIYEGRYDLAVEESQLVLELSPNNTMALKRMGSAYYLMGKNGNAEKVWKRALRLTPNDDELKGFLEILK